MRIWSLMAAIAVGIFTATTTLAQEAAGNAAAASKMPVAVVDTRYILENHPTMKSEMENIKTQMEAADKQMAEKRDAIVKQMEQLREQYVEGTPEYDRAEKAIAEQDTEFRLELVKKRKEFETAQANLMYKIYSEINVLLKYWSDNYGISMIVRVNREQMDPKKPETVQMVMSQDVLYFSKSVDLTEPLLDYLNKQAGKTANAGAAPRR